MFYEKRMGHEVEADGLGDEWKVCLLNYFMSMYTAIILTQERQRLFFFFL